MLKNLQKGIATQTIFYIVIGIVVVGLITTTVISYTGTARENSDCRIGEQRYCEYWETQDPTDSERISKWHDSFKGKCDKYDSGKAPIADRCRIIGYNIE